MKCRFALAALIASIASHFCCPTPVQADQPTYACPFVEQYEAGEDLPENQCNDYFNGVDYSNESSNLTESESASAGEIASDSNIEQNQDPSWQDAYYDYESEYYDWSDYVDDAPVASSDEVAADSHQNHGSDPVSEYYDDFSYESEYENAYNESSTDTNEQSSNATDSFSEYEGWYYSEEPIAEATQDSGSADDAAGRSENATGEQEYYDYGYDEYGYYDDEEAYYEDYQYGANPFEDESAYVEEEAELASDPIPMPPAVNAVDESESYDLYEYEEYDYSRFASDAETSDSTSDSDYDQYSDYWNVLPAPSEGEDYWGESDDSADVTDSLEPSHDFDYEYDGYEPSNYEEWEFQYEATAQPEKTTDTVSEQAELRQCESELELYEDEWNEELDCWRDWEPVESAKEDVQVSLRRVGGQLLEMTANLLSDSARTLDRVSYELRQMGYSVAEGAANRERK